MKDDKHTLITWEERALRLQKQLRSLIYGYRISGVEALKSPEWSIVYDIAESVLNEPNPSLDILKATFDTIHKENEKLKVELGLLLNRKDAIIENQALSIARLSDIIEKRMRTEYNP